VEEKTWQITGIETQKNNPDRVNIYLDGAFGFGLARQVVIQQHLHEGDRLTDAVIDRVLLKEEIVRAKNGAIRLLSYRARSVEELRKKLSERGYSSRVIERVIGDFLRAGLLDDRSFAMAFARSRLSQKTMGKRLLRQEVMKKGIPGDLAEEAVEEAFGEREETDLALELGRKKRKLLKGDALQVKRKLSAFLYRRGFSWDVIAQVLKEVV
jgi:regulatory protein